MRITPQIYAQSLFEALSEVGPLDTEKVLENFVKVLNESGHAFMWPDIEAEFLKCEVRQRGQVSASAVFAREGRDDSEVLADLNAFLGGNLVFKKKLDEKLVGGVLIETEDERLDLSVKRQLENMRKQLST